MAFGLIFCDISPSCHPIFSPFSALTPGLIEVGGCEPPPRQSKLCPRISLAAGCRAGLLPKAVLPDLEQSCRRHLNNTCLRASLARCLNTHSSRERSLRLEHFRRLRRVAALRCLGRKSRCAACQTRRAPGAQLRPRVLRPSSCRRRARAGAGSCRFSSAPPPARRAASAAPTAPRAGPWPASRSGSVPPWSW